MTSTAVKSVIENVESLAAKQGWNPLKQPNTMGTGALSAAMGFVRGSYHNEQIWHCHNPIRSFTQADALYSKYGYRVNQEVAKAYAHWLAYESPWARAGVKPLFLEDKEFVFTKGFVFDNLKQLPGNLLFNFLIASRMAAEWPNHIRLWHELVTAHKTQPDLAFYFLTVFRPINPGTYDQISWDKDESYLTNQDKYDWPLNIYTADEEYLLNFLSAEPVGPSKKSFYEDSSVPTINTLWGNPAKKLEYYYVTYIDNMYRGKYSTPRQLGGGSKFGANTINKTYKAPEIIEIIKLEQKRLGL